MSYDRKGQRYCDGCGRSIDKAHRRYHGDDYCSSCYLRLFVRMPCRVCGELARFHQHAPEVERVCGKCERERRKCLRCGKPLPRAAKRVAGGAVCASCAHYFVEKKPCSRCGRLSTKLSRAPALGAVDPICDHCRNRLTHKTCSVCRRYRAVAGTFLDGKHYCAACLPGAAESHICPTCGATVPGAGNGRCLACLNRERIEREVSLQQMVLSQVWAQKLYAGFGEWLVAGHPTDRRLLPTLTRHFTFFETLDAGCHHLGEVTSGFLLDRLGAAGLRVHALPVEYLRACCDVSIDDGEKADHVERDRISTIVARESKEPWGGIVQRYDVWLASKGTAIRTRRLYLSAAAKFCRVEAINAEDRYTSDQIRHFLRSYPGLRANLFKWNAFAKEILRCNAAIPPPRPRKRRPRTARDLGVLLSKIKAVGDERAPVKLLERAIAKAFGYTVGRFRAYAWSVEHESSAIWLCHDEERLRVPGALVSAVVAWARRVDRRTHREPR